MGSYSDWITSRRELYKTAITSAYDAHVDSSGNDYETAYDAMAGVSEIEALIPPTNVVAFYGGSPNATESQITTLQTWLQANPIVAGQLNLSSQSDATSAAGRVSLGTSGNVGSERRKWKGNPLYTFANGVLIGKDEKIIAAIGTDGGTSIDGFGTDTLVYFDGIPFSKGTGLPGTAVFGGDVVVSGSIQGTNGVVVIDDVIQLERGVSNPAGIGVDDSGKIRLRHRGEGFLDLVDEIETAKSGSIEDAKLWVGAQNTSAARWGSSLIPNSNFAQIENSGTGGSYAERPAGVISVGSTSNIITYSSGIVTFNPNGKGIAFQAIPVTADRYTVRIRYKASSSVHTLTPATQGVSEGLFIGFHETTVEDLGEKLYVYDGSEFSPAIESSKSSDVHASSVSVEYVTGNRSTDGSTFDGSPITASYVVKSYTYSPSSSAKNASLVIHGRNYNHNLDIDYIVMTEAPQTSSEISNLISNATSNIQGETGSDITDAQMTDKTNWAAVGSASLSDLPTGGDGGDEAIRVTTSGSGQGITSTSIDCVSDTYLVGIRIKTSTGTTNIQLDGIETAGPYFGSLGSTHPKLAPGASNYRTKSIILSEINDSTGIAKTSPSPSESMEITDNWKTFVGTYQPNKLDPASYATGYTTPTDGSGDPFMLPGKFSLAIRADSAATFDVDYVYAAVQGSSVNVAQELANSAYGDSQTFVTQINDLLIKESGSIVQNSSMALPSTSSNGPAGYRARGTGATIATVGTGAQNKSVKVTSSSSGNLTLISPPFSLGETDKYSIGVRIKSLESGAVSAKVDVAYSADDVPTDKVTLAASGPSDVYVTNTSEVAVTIDDGSDTGGGSLSSNQYDLSVGTLYQSILATWDRKAADGTYAKKNASIVITCDGDFEVDYILVKEQICSFDLADTQAQTRRDEAIAQSEGYLTGLSETMAQESGSLMSNAGFGSWYLTNGTTGDQRPQGWYTTRNNSSSPLRVIAASEGANSTGETVENVNQTGSALKFSPGASGGMLSPKFDLPISPAFGSEIDSSQEASGKYTLAIRVRLGSAEPVGIRLYAHEYYKFTDTVQTHVLCTDHAYGTTTYESTTKIKAFTTSAENGAVSRIKLINFTENDTVVGYGSDEYIEYIPVDNSETQGDTDGVASNYATWYQIGGTYSPNASTKQVSFEVVIVGDPDSDSTYPNVYIDYVNLVSQPFDADFAQSLADARTQSLTGITSDGTFGDGSRLLAASILDARSRLATTEATLALESPDTSLLPNSFFADYTGGLPASPHNWVGTRDTDATVQIKAAAYDSYNTYVELGANAVSDETHGMLSKAVAIVGDGITTFGICNGGLNPTFNTSTSVTYPTFDLVLRYRTLMTPTNVVSTGVRINATASDSATSNISALSTAPTTIKNGLGQTLTITSASEPRYDVGDDAHTGTYWDIPWSSLGDGSTNDSNATELIFVFHAQDTDAEKDPVVSFTNSSNALVAMSGVVQVWDNSGALEYENTFTNKNTIWNYTNPDIVASGTLLSGDTDQRWVVFKLRGGFGSGLHRIKVRGGTGEYTGDNFYVRNFNFFSYVQPSAEMVGVTMLAHEFYGDSLDSGKEHVFANGDIYTLASSATKVQRYYTSGTLGGVQTVQTILSTADSDLEDEKATTLNTWNTLVGAYTPSASAKWVSFEFVFNEDKDNDDVLPLILIDGILLQQSDGSSLAQTIKTTAEAAQSTADENMIIQTGMGNEQDSLIANAGFLSPKTITNNAAPAGFFPFATGTPGLVKIQNLDSTQSKTLTNLATFTSNTLPTETVTPFYDAGQNDTCMAVLGTNYVDPYKAGFYTTAMMLPTGAPYTYTDNTGASVTDTGKGKYTIAFKVKPASGSNPISVSIFAHEYDTSNSPATDGNYVYSAADSTYKTFGTDSAWNASIGAPVISTRSPIAINTLQLSNPADSSPSTHEVVSASSWTTVGGTYSPTSTAACVSFSVVFSFDTDDSTPDNTAENTPDGPDTSQNITLGSARDIRAIAYVDYVLCMTQTLTADLADNLAAGRAYAVQQTLEADITDLEDNLGAESDSLMPNGNFQQTYTNSSTSYIKNWMFTRALTAAGVQPTAAANGSIGTYVNLPLPSNSTTNTAGGGIISKSVEGLYTQAIQEGGTLGSYNIGIRCRGVSGTGTLNISNMGTTASVWKQYYLKGTNSGAYQYTYSSYLSGYNSTTTSNAYDSPAEAYDQDSTVYRGQDVNKLLDYHYGLAVRVNSPSSNISRTLTVTLPFTPTANIVHIYFGMRTVSWTNLSTSTWRVSTHNSSDSLIDFGSLSVSVVDSYTTNGVIDWVSKSSVETGKTNYFTLPQGFNSDDSNWVRITIDAGAGASANALQYLNKIKLTSETFGGGVYTNTDFYASNFQMVEVFEPQDHSFTVQILAHEYTGTTAPNTLYYDSSVTIPTAHSENMTVTSSGNSTVAALNIIDLRYSQSTASSEITISSRDQDTGEHITDWRSIVGSYQPSSNLVTATAFEIKFEGDPDGDTAYQTVHLDSVTMGASSLSTDLANTVSDNRIFVEQNFMGGGSVVDTNSVIFNGDFAIAAKTFPESETLFPAGWYPWYAHHATYLAQIGINDDTIFGYTTSSSASNRVIGWNPVRSSPGEVDSDGDGTIDNLTPPSGLIGIVSRPFQITSTSYKFKMTYKVVATDGSNAAKNKRVDIYPLFLYSSQDISQDVRAFLYSGFSSFDQTIRPTTTTTINSNGTIVGSGNYSYGDGLYSETTAKSAGAFHEIGYHSSSALNTNIPTTGGTPFNQVHVMEFTYTTPLPTSDKDPIKWANLQIWGVTEGEYNQEITKIELIDIQLVPNGNAYGSGTGQLVDIVSPTYDNQKDPAPPAPRDTSVQTALYKGTDIEIVPTPSGYDGTQYAYNFPKGRILAALPRKVYTTSTSTNVNTSKGEDGVSYFYPGPTSFSFKDDTYTNADTGQSYIGTTLDLNDGAITEVSRIQMVTPSDSNFPAGSSQHDRLIYNIGALEFDPTFEPTGLLGAEPSDAIVQAVGPSIKNVKSIYIGAGTYHETAWGSNTGQLTQELNPSTGNNNKGGIYIKQQNPPYCITMINNGNGNNDRWVMGESNSDLTFRYATNATATPSEMFKVTETGRGQFTDGVTALTSYGITRLHPDSASEINFRIHSGQTPNSYWGLFYDEQYGAQTGDEDYNVLSFYYYKGSNSSTPSSGIKANIATNQTEIPMNFTGQHRVDSADNITTSQQGLIVRSIGRYNNIVQNDKPTINSALPLVELTSKRNDKSCFGVVSKKENNTPERVYRQGAFISRYEKNGDVDRLIVNSLGEGAVWICNISGNLENGDYITTCEIPGYGMLQDDDLLHNYTVAKITQDCNFELDNSYYDCVEFEFEGNTYRKAFVGCTYHCG